MKKELNCKRSFFKTKMTKSRYNNCLKGAEENLEERTKTT